MISVDILLATYNGGTYLHSLIDSLYRQSHGAWNLIIRDDGSSDDTVNYLEKLSANDSRVEIIKDELGNLGPCRNFLELLKHSNSEYILFCDQDDIWEDNKISTLLSFIKAEEKRNDSNLPILIHSDIQLIDEKDELISNSFWKYQHLNPRCDSFNDLLMQNNVTGCTCIFNKALKTKGKNSSDDIPMHDWWLAITAAKFGFIKYVEKPLVRYRQHGSNSVGARKFYSLKSLGQFFKKIQGNKKHTQVLAKAFLDNYKNELSEEDIKFLQVFGNFDELGYFEKRKFIIKNHLKKQGFLRTLAFYLFA